MWTVFESREARKLLPDLPLPIRERYEAWKLVVQTGGPLGLRMIKGFRDEALQGKWRGHRSSRLNAQYRVVYRVDGEAISVYVERVTPHDYRR